MKMEREILSVFGENTTEEKATERVFIKKNPQKNNGFVFLVCFLFLGSLLYTNLALAGSSFETLPVEKDSPEKDFVDIFPSVTAGHANTTYYNEQDDLPRPDAACSAKSGEISKFVEFMDNSIIKTLEQVASIMFMLCTVMSAISIVLDTVYEVLCSCPLDINPYTKSACASLQSAATGFQEVYTPVIKPLCCFVQCKWCSGEGADCMGTFGGLTDLYSKIPGPSGESGGISAYHLSPFENIYTAVGCLCPVAVLFNLRKLKTIYQVYDCCIEESCNEGLPTQDCEAQLEEATCMYWQGSLANMAIKILLSIISSIAAEYIISVVSDNLVKLAGSAISYCIMALFEFTTIPGTIQGVIGAWGWMATTFEEPTCKDLGFEDIKDDQARGYLSENRGINNLVMADLDGNGIFDSTSLSYEIEKGVEWEGDDKGGLEKGETYTRYTTRKDGGTIFYYGDKEGFLGEETIYDSNGREIKEEKEWLKIRRESDPSIEGITFLTGGKVARIEGTLYTWEIKEDQIILTGRGGGTTEYKLADLAGTNRNLAGVYLGDLEKEGDKIMNSEGNPVSFTGKEGVITARVGSKTVGKQFSNGDILEFDDGVATYTTSTSRNSYQIDGANKDTPNLDVLIGNLEASGLGQGIFGGKLKELDLVSGNIEVKSGDITWEFNKQGIVKIGGEEFPVGFIKHIGAENFIISDNDKVELKSVTGRTLEIGDERYTITEGNTITTFDTTEMGNYLKATRENGKTTTSIIDSSGETVLILAKEEDINSPGLVGLYTVLENRENIDNLAISAKRLDMDDISGAGDLMEVGDLDQDGKIETFRLLGDKNKVIKEYNIETKTLTVAIGEGDIKKNFRTYTYGDGDKPTSASRTTTTDGVTTVYTERTGAGAGAGVGGEATFEYGRDTYTKLDDNKIKKGDGTIISSDSEGYFYDANNNGKRDVSESMKSEFNILAEEGSQTFEYGEKTYIMEGDTYYRTENGEKIIIKNDNGKWYYDADGDNQRDTTSESMAQGFNTEADKATTTPGEVGPSSTISIGEDTFTISTVDGKITLTKGGIEYTKVDGKWEDGGGVEADEPLSEILNEASGEAASGEEDLDKDQFRKDYIEAEKREAIILEAAKHEFVENRIRQGTWYLLNDILGEYAYGAVDEMCKVD